ncbi:MAG: porin [Rhodoferax sp.]|uniref:porin n=1 Tax=Rhodoferax sp. TaxID=50421 RepID=UPI003016BD5E
MSKIVKHSLQKKIVALAALALVSGAALAQSNVTIYGAIDLGLLVQNNTGPAVSSPQLYNGGISPSIWGFRGSEDLGGGLKANFNLESHFSADTGAGTTTFFRRQSNVGFSSASMGTLTLGNQYGPAVLAFAATDPRGLRENFSGLYSWAYNSGALIPSLPAPGTNNGNNDVGVFLQNAISYNNTLGPVGLGVAYSVSEDKGAVVSLGATYAGPVSLSAAYQTTNLPKTSDQQSALYTVGAGYTMGAFTGKLNYLRGTNKDSSQVETSNVEVVGLGLDWKLAPNNTVILAAYFGKDKNDDTNKTTSYILSDEYALSKRTTLYATAAFVSADKMAKGGSSNLLTSVVAGGTGSDNNASLFNFGVKHSF